LSSRFSPLTQLQDFTSMFRMTRRLCPALLRIPVATVLLTVIILLVSATSSEPDSAKGFLRASRLGSGRGRIYTLMYTGSDLAGNTASCTATVRVPHDQGE
jgi:hypothetical protein